MNYGLAKRLEDNGFPFKEGKSYDVAANPAALLPLPRIPTLDEVVEAWLVLHDNTSRTS